MALPQKKQDWSDDSFSQRQDLRLVAKDGKILADDTQAQAARLASQADKSPQPSQFRQPQSTNAQSQPTNSQPIVDELAQRRAQQAAALRAQEDQARNPGASRYEKDFAFNPKTGNFGIEGGQDEDSDESWEDEQFDDSEQEQDMVDEARQAEEAPSGAASDVNYSGRSEEEGEEKPSGPLRGMLKFGQGGSRNFGPTGILITILMAGLGISTPSIVASGLIQQFSDILKDRNNSQGRVADSRTSRLRRSKFSQWVGEKIDKVKRKDIRFSTASEADVEFAKTQSVKPEMTGGGGELDRAGKYVSIEYEGRVGDSTKVSSPAEFDSKVVDGKNYAVKNANHKSQKGWVGVMYDSVAEVVTDFFKFSRQGLYSKKISDADDPDRPPPDAADPDTDTDRAKTGDAVDEGIGKQIHEQVLAGEEPRGLTGKNTFDDTDDYKATDGDQKSQSELDRLQSDVKAEAEGGKINPSDVEASKIGSRIGAGISAASGIAGVCSIYHMFDNILNDARVQNAIKIARFAMTFLAFADQIKVGSAQEEVIANRGNALTYSEARLDQEGNLMGTRNAPDSLGFNYAQTGEVNGDIMADASASQYINGPIGPVAAFFSQAKTALRTDTPWDLLSLLDTACGVAVSVAPALGVADYAMTAFAVVASAPATGGLSLVAAIAAELLKDQMVEVLIGVGATQLGKYVFAQATGLPVGIFTLGEDLGNALASGTGKVMSSVGQAGGNGLMTKTDTIAFLEDYEVYLAERGKMLRTELSPFDISTRHTFMGSIFNQAMPYIGKTASLSAQVSAVMNMGFASLGSIIPTSKAQDAMALRQNTLKAISQCPDPELLDKDGKELRFGVDPFCNPIQGVPVGVLKDDSGSWDPNKVANYIYKESGDTYQAKYDAGEEQYIFERKGLEEYRVIDESDLVVYRNTELKVDGRLYSVSLKGRNTPSLRYKYMEPINYQTKQFDPTCDPANDINCDLAIRKEEVKSNGTSDNKLYDYLRNCVERGAVPYIAGFEGEDKKPLDDGSICILDTDEKKNFSLYFVDERIQCLLDDGKDCQLEGKLGQYTSGSAARADRTVGDGRNVPGPSAGGSGPATLKEAQNSGWGGFSNGKIPADKLVRIPFNTSHRLHTDAVAALAPLNNAFKAEFGKNLTITDSYRSYEAQVICRRNKGSICAVPGTSNHGWGLALDFGGGINSFGTKEYNWMMANAPNYGWINPYWARPGGSNPEPWHWEYARPVQ